MGFFDTSKSSTSNSTQNYDSRQVNTITTTSNDLSDRSVNNNNSVNSSVTNLLDGGAVAGMASTALAAINGASKGVSAGYDYADHVFDAATLYANKVGVRELDAFSQAASMSSDALTTARSAYESANKSIANAYGGAQDSVLTAFKAAQIATADAQAATQSAYADAKGTTGAQKQIIIAVLAVAGLMALAAMSHK